VEVDEQADPEREVLLADTVGLALLVVLETLTPTKRVAYVLHDMFAVPFAEMVRDTVSSGDGRRPGRPDHHGPERSDSPSWAV
jgi:hypothetical protein